MTQPFAISPSQHRKRSPALRLPLRIAILNPFVLFYNYFHYNEETPALLLLLNQDCNYPLSFFVNSYGLSQRFALQLSSDNLTQIKVC